KEDKALQRMTFVPQKEIPLSCITVFMFSFHVYFGLPHFFFHSRREPIISDWFLDTLNLIAIQATPLYDLILT
ncbi:hypothetical protein L9F63_009071, partial [Diploptera punctata]